jgi:pseudouridine-5'-phosphate glycosidase/pseudouridine kinase
VGALLATLAQNPDALHHPQSLQDAVLISQRAAVLTLQSHHAVSPVLQEMTLPRI